MIRVVVPVLVKNGKKAEFLKKAENLVIESRKEKGCIEYNLIDSGIEDQLYFIEKWETIEDLKIHSKAPHSEKYREILNPLKIKNLPVEVYKIDKENAILTRRSIRNYNSKEVSGEIVERILKAAMHAPTAGNQQGWEFIVVKNKGVLDALSKISPYATPLQKANIAIVVLGNKEVKYPQNLEQDLAAATQNILLQITEEGLGGVWLGIAPEKERMNKAKEILNLNNNILPFCIIPFGYSDEKGEFIDKYDVKKVKYID